MINTRPLHCGCQGKPPPGGADIPCASTTSSFREQAEKRVAELERRDRERQVYAEQRAAEAKAARAFEAYMGVVTSCGRTAAMRSADTPPPIQ